MMSLRNILRGVIGISCVVIVHRLSEHSQNYHRRYQKQSNRLSVDQVKEEKIKRDWHWEMKHYQ
jgi:hypothetical protein